jgi:hypothetical protein
MKDEHLTTTHAYGKRAAVTFLRIKVICSYMYKSNTNLYHVEY